MHTPALEVSGDTAILRIAGPQTFSVAVEQVTRALEEVAGSGHRNLIVDVSLIQGIHPPGVAARHAMARTWAAAAQGRVRLAMVAREEFMDPERFGVVASASFGLDTNIFATEAEARAWLAERAEG